MENETLRCAQMQLCGEFFILSPSVGFNRIYGNDTDVTRSQNMALTMWLTEEHANEQYVLFWTCEPQNTTRVP